jgi:manganese oxidase
MSSDVRLQLLGWSTVVGGAAHVAAGATHGHADRVHVAGLLVLGALQLLVGGRLLAPTPGLRWRNAAVALSAATVTGLAFERAGGDGGHGFGALAALALAAAGVAIVVECARHFRARPAIPLVVVALVAGGIGPSPHRAGAVDDNQPAGCSTPNRRMTLYAEQLAPDPESGDVRLGWGLTPTTASIPGPLIQMVEGDCLAITVVNDVSAETLRTLRTDPDAPIGVSLHVHGVKYRPASDGTKHADSWVAPGTSRTFVWYAQPRVVAAGKVTSNGTAGAWWYHDHVVGTVHGTGGIEAGLVGGLVVRRATDPVPDRSFTVVMGPRDRINDRKPEAFCADGPESLPSDGCFKAVEGERVEFVVFNVGDSFHTFHLHGHNWADNRTGIPDANVDTQLIDARGIGPSESFGFQVIAGESVGAGNWMLHCHVQTHSDHGMATTFEVRPKGAALTDATGALPVHTH